MNKDVNNRQVKINKTIIIRKKIILAAMFVIAGFVLLFAGLNKKLFYRHIDLQDLQLEDVKPGVYITGQVTSCVGKELQTEYFTGGWVTCSMTYLNGDTEYNFFTIPIRDSYIQIMIDDKELYDKLDNLEEDNAVDFYLEGEIVKSPVVFNREWFDDVDREKYKNIDNMVTDYVIKQTIIEDNKFTIYAGICLLLSAAIIFLYEFKLKKLYDKTG